VPADFTTLGGATWLADGRILFVTGSSAIYETTSTGGEARLVLEALVDDYVERSRFAARPRHC
jgi:hypothetical protein